MGVVDLFKDSDYNDEGQITINIGNKKMTYDCDNQDWIIKTLDNGIIARTEHEDIAVKILTSEDII